MTERLPAQLVDAHLARRKVETQLSETLEQAHELAVRLSWAEHGVADADDALSDATAAERSLAHAPSFASGQNPVRNRPSLSNKQVKQAVPTRHQP